MTSGHFTFEMRISVEIDASPEAVWEAIATPEGLGAWFVPVVIEGDTMTMEALPGQRFPATVVASEPPRRFAFREEGGDTSFEITPRAVGCTVVLEGHDDEEEAWRVYLDVLGLYLRRFDGRPHGAVHLADTADGTLEDVFGEHARTHGVQEAEVGSGAAAQVAGHTFECSVVDAGPRHVLARVTHPEPGILLVAVGDASGGRCHRVVRLHLYGERGQALAAQLRRTGA